MPRVLGYALRRTNAEEARDVVSETFTVAWRKFEDVPEGEAAMPWLLSRPRARCYSEPPARGREPDARIARRAARRGTPITRRT